MSYRLLAAAGLGAVTGLRSMTGIAMASRELTDRPAGELVGLRRWLARDPVNIALSALAIGELVADKMPDLPDRVDTGPLVGRGVMGALVGAVAGGEDHWMAGALVGAAASMVAAWAGWSVRKEAGWATGLPDPVIAMAEDAVAITAAREAARAM